MGATFMVAGLVASSAYYGWRLHENQVPLLSAILGVLATTFLAAGIGKVIGILQHRLRQRTSILFFPLSLTRKGH
jgi:hypothetical protein